MTAPRIVEDLPDPGERGAPRYSRQPLPPYRYVPGRHPHPHRDPQGHSYTGNLRSTSHPIWTPNEWRRLDEWLFGVDLFNRFFFWEAHEAWEALWAVSRRGEPPALLLQGLIQIAAALLKVHAGVLAGARTLSHGGVDKLRRGGAHQPHLLGLDVVAVASQWIEYFEPLKSDRLPALDATVPALVLSFE